MRTALIAGALAALAVFTLSISGSAGPGDALLNAFSIGFLPVWFFTLVIIGFFRILSDASYHLSKRP